MRSRVRALFAVSLALSCAVFAACEGRASAEPKGALDEWTPAPAGDSFFSVPSADVTGGLKPSIALAVSYAKDPLVLRPEQGGGSGPSLFRWVSYQAVFHALVSVEIAKRIKVDLDLPATLGQSGSSGSLGPITVAGPSGAALGDLRLGARVAVLHQDGFVPAASLSLSVWVPTGAEERFSGASGVRLAPAVHVGADYGRVLWSLTLARRFAQASPDNLIGSQTTGGAAFGVRVGPVQLGPEVFFAVGSGDSITSIARAGFALEAMLTARGTFGPLMVGLGGGPGFGHEIGTPTFRLFGTVGFAMDLLPGLGSSGGDRGDRGAGANRGAGAVPSPPVPAALADRDGDGIPDASDACPGIVGIKSADPAKNGCPADRDGDGIYDVDDACPDEKGAPSADPKKHGCVPDTDGDGIKDTEDACPNERGERTSDPKTNGCPKAVRVVGQQIVILDQVHFETGKAIIKPESFPLLQQVADVLRDHPEIARLAVDGHTDNVGSERSNIALSQQRALSVMRWLTEHGVDARRLEARGFGPRRPVDDNKTDAGKAKNRRVEFQIRKRTDKGEAGWKDGPIE